MVEQGLWLTLAALALAGVVQGSSGFGFSLVAVGLVGMALGDTKAGTIVPIFANLTLTSFMLIRFRHHFRWHKAAPFLAGSLIGVPFGVWLLVSVPVVWINLGLASVLMVSGSYGLLPSHRRRDWHPLWLGVPLGLLSGGLSGAFNTGGPAAVAYFSNQSLSRFSYVACLQFIFTMSGILRLGCLFSQELLTAPIVTVGLIGTIAAIFGCLAGNWILHRISDRHLRLYVCAMQIGLGLVYVWRTLGSLG